RIRRRTRRISREDDLHSPVVRSRKCTAIACRVGWGGGDDSDALSSFIEGAANKVVHFLVKYGTTRAMHWARGTNNKRLIGCAKDASDAWIETKELRAAGAADGPGVEAG